MENTISIKIHSRSMFADDFDTMALAVTADAQIRFQCACRFKLLDDNPVLWLARKLKNFTIISYIIFFQLR